jgi:membrane protease YdiL (CAAX protease family)
MKQARFLLEMALCFLVFFLPGYMAQSSEPASRAVSSSVMIQSIILGIPQFLLLVYITSLSKETPMESWGFSRFRATDALRIVLVLIACYAVFTPFAIFVMALPKAMGKYLASGFRWRLAGVSQIPLAVVFGLVAGYREEFFFRSYLLRRMDQLGLPVALSVAVSTLLFSAGHLYQGPLGAAMSAALGVLFAGVFLRNRNLHVIAIAHGLYNASVLCLSLLSVSPLPGSG